MRKMLMGLIIILVALLSIVTVSAGWFGDDVTVKGVDVGQFPVGDKFIVALVPNTDIEHINNIYLKNIEIQYPDGSFKADDLNLQYDIHAADNLMLDQYDYMLKNYQFELSFIIKNLTDANRNVNSYPMKADIVVDTTTQDGVVIGHIDTDAVVVRSLNDSSGGNMWTGDK